MAGNSMVKVFQLMRPDQAINIFLGLQGDILPGFNIDSGMLEWHFHKPCQYQILLCYNT